MRSDNGELEHSQRGARYSLRVARPVLSGILIELRIIIREAQLLVELCLA